MESAANPIPMLKAQRVFARGYDVMASPARAYPSITAGSAVTPVSRNSRPILATPGRRFQRVGIAALLVLEPFVSLILTGLAFLGMVIALILEFSGDLGCAKTPRL
jgi:hypothetical protein